ncbi:uncharacterized protein LOC143566992 [Bidens hawaiensis]|uniref:uncharacterized protein LOC143566992 n=1 Tax=Bidens hawaiensis TaxID=980011 RepID=UPI0040492AC6
MLSTLSRFIDASTISKSPSQCSTSLTFNPTSQASLLRNKNLASYGLHGLIAKSLQYNPTPRNFVVCNNITPPGAPLPSGSPSGSLKNWVVGIALTIILPLIIRKGSFIQIKNKVNTVVETMDHVMESVEKVAKGTDEIIDGITDNLPQSQLKETLEAIDKVAEDVAKHAHVVNEIIDKVEETEKELDSLILDEVKEKEVSEQVLQISTQEQSVEK